MLSLFDRCIALKANTKDADPWRVVFAEVEKQYQGDDRNYHDLRHIHRMLDELDRWRPELDISTQHLIALELAVIYHDVVFVPKAKDNEILSAAWAVRDLSKLGVGARIVRTTERAILATINHVSSRRDRVSCLLIDLDLCSMAFAAEYLENGERIRQEFSMFDEEEFRTGQASFLRAFLSRRRVFRSPFALRYEGSARQNMRADLERMQMGERVQMGN